MENEKMIIEGNYGGNTYVAMEKNPEFSIGVFSDEAIARRLVAAWNACEGIPTEELESKGADAGFMATLDKVKFRQLQDENAALRAALREMERVLPGFQEIERLHPGALEQYGIATLNAYRQTLETALAKINEK